MKNKNIIVAITGGIAAYKSAELVRLLCQSGAAVRVIMTAGAKEFITPLTLQALSGNTVRDDLFSLEAENAMTHIECARWADFIVVAPATASCLAHLAHGFADNLLSTVCLATRAPIALVPAMNQAMWGHPLTQENVLLLKRHHYFIWGPAAGEQACGDTGPGRMWEPTEIAAAIREQFQQVDLSGKKIVITAGPTREALDPVRSLTNHSSGKMGYALAEAAKNQGAEVVLISGPTYLTPPQGVICIHVESALSMQRAVAEQLASEPIIDLFIGAAAVTDYRPAEYSDHKIKKTANKISVTLSLTLNPDIIAEVALAARRPRCVVGFAAETQDCIAQAMRKLRDKKLDVIIANEVGQDKGFDQDEHAVVILGPEGIIRNLGSMLKQKLAQNIIKVLIEKSYHVPNRD